MKLILSRGDKIVIQTTDGATIVVTAEVNLKGGISLNAAPGRNCAIWKTDTSNLTVHR